jgi:Xaa-Pro aminopeptidase
VNTPDYSRRVDGVRAALAAENVDALLVTDLVNVRYLTGYGGSNGLVLVGSDGATFMTDFRYVTAAEPIADFMTVLMLEGETARFLGEHLASMAPAATRIGIEAPHVSVALQQKLAAAFGPDIELVPTADVVETLRLVKDASELDAIRRSAALIAPVYEAIAAEGLGGKRELDVAWRVRELFHQQGADGLAFETIVASHERGAMPHATPSEAVIAAGTLVTIDLGCYLDGYASDCTRTFAVGEPDADLAEIYGICLEAQLAAMDAVKPGAGGRDVDAVAREVIVAAGHGDHFGHGLGHGVGLAIHEGPRLATSSRATLEVGMVVTVEPGIYVPGRGGVRIEDLVIVTDSGAERLTPYPKELQLVA